MTSKPKLNWKPQESFADYFLTRTEDLMKYRSVFRPDIEYFVAHGGRGSAKSYSFVEACVTEASIRPVRVLVCREIQESIAESTKRDVESYIIENNLTHFFDIQKEVINGANGSRFIFKGLKNNINSLKSISDVDIVLAEEAESITKNSWDKFLPSIRPRDKITRGGAPIIIIIFNPDDELDDTYQRFVINPPERSVVKQINYPDNIFFPPHLERQRLHAKRTKPPKEYEHDWLGKPKGAGENVIIDKDWIIAARFASQHPDFKKAGKKEVGYDPAGQGKDSHAVVYVDGNILTEIDEWVLSDDLRDASERAFRMALKYRADRFSYDTCGGLGDGVSVFIDDAKSKNLSAALHIAVSAFDAGSPPEKPDENIDGSPIDDTRSKSDSKTWGNSFINEKGQAWSITAQKLYNTYRFVVLGETDQDPESLCSIDIVDDDMFNKLAKELSSPLWVKSKTNSKKKVESKPDMEKRIGQKSPNIGDAYVMTNAFYKNTFECMVW